MDLVVSYFSKVYDAIVLLEKKKLGYIVSFVLIPIWSTPKHNPW